MKIPEEMNSDRINNRKTHSFTSNWTIASGSFDDSLSFESSESPIDPDGVNLFKKQPLVLKPLDSSPCEINLTFMQKHEIRQVYVRSTARVYEIYYKPDIHSSTEYLCTVRCSIAAREDDLLHESNHGEAAIEPTKESDRDYNEKKSPSRANEDDWVEVKNPESPVVVINSMPEAVIGYERSLQDFYEATAEISDGEPSVTLILRLLSLENKGHVYVDEVYVYADAVESTDLENHAAQNLQGGASAGSSLMTMFLPTLLQLTRSNVGQSQDRLISNKMVGEESSEKGTRKKESTSNLNEQDERSKVPDRQDVKFQEVEKVTAQPTPQFQKSAPIENVGKYHSVVDSNNYIGRVMEQLILRMSRIEDICLRFEEKMVHPISSMEERLQHVENQLEMIVKNTQTSELPSCTRFSAPAFSSLDSASSSFYSDGCTNPPYVQSELEKHEPPFNDDISKSHEENLKSERAPQFIPSYVVTAPEFSCDEEDEQNDAAEPLRDSLCEKPKKPMSIDDALAAALAGFSSLTISEPSRPSERVTSVTNEENDTNEDSNCTSYPQDKPLESTDEETAGKEHLKHTQGLKFTPPDFASEDSYNDKVVTPRPNDVNLVRSSGTISINGGENTLDIASAPSISSALEKEETVIFRKENLSEQFCEGHSDADSFGRANNCPAVQAKGDYWATGEISMRESSSSKDKLSILDRFEVVKQLLAKSKDGVGTADKVSGPISICAEGGSGNDISSVAAKDDYRASGQTSMLESSSSKDKLLISERLKNFKQLLAKTMDGVGTAEEISGPISKIDESGSGNDISSLLDFETSILEVKFTSQENTSSALPLEDLLTDPEAGSEFSFAQSKNGESEITTEEIDLSFVVNEEKMRTWERNTFPLVDLESYDAPVFPENAQGQQVPIDNKEHEVFSSLI